MDLGSIISLMDFASNRINNLFNTGFQIANTGYQHRLQQQIFGREDTAVQRRMADLKAAGLNPNLAAGSAASSGSVVSSVTPQSDFGNALDNLAALTQIKAQKAQTENLKVQNDLLNGQLNLLNNQDYSQQLENNLKYIDYCNQLGIRVGVDSKNPMDLYFDANSTTPNATDNSYVHYLDDSPMKRLFNYTVQNGENNASLLQNEANFYQADKYSGYAKDIIQAFLGLMRLIK